MVTNNNTQLDAHHCRVLSCQIQLGWERIFVRSRIQIHLRQRLRFSYHESSFGCVYELSRVNVIRMQRSKRNAVPATAINSCPNELLQVQSRPSKYSLVTNWIIITTKCARGFWSRISSDSYLSKWPALKIVSHQKTELCSALKLCCFYPKNIGWTRFELGVGVECKTGTQLIFFPYPL